MGGNTANEGNEYKGNATAEGRNNDLNHHQPRPNNNGATSENLTSNNTNSTSLNDTSAISCGADAGSDKTTCTNTGSTNDDESQNKKRKLSNSDNKDNDNNHNNTQNSSSSNNNNNKKKKSKKTKTKHLDPKILTLRRTIHLCCATNDFHTAIQAYQSMHIEQNVTMEPQSLYNLLNLCEGGLGGERGVHVGTPKNSSSSSNSNSRNKNDDDKDMSSKSHETKIDDSNNCKDNNTVTAIKKDDEIKPQVEEEKMKEMETEEKTTTTTTIVSSEPHHYSPSERKEYAFQIKKELDKLQIPLNETAYTALLRILCQPENNNLIQAEELLTGAEATQQCKPKLRMYSCLIDAFCNSLNNNLVGALKIWSRMGQLKKRKTKPKKNGDPQKDNSSDLVPTPIDMTEREYCFIMKCAIRIGDIGVVERVISEIAEDILVPSLNTKDTIVSWFQSCHAVVDTNPTDTTVPTTSAIDTMKDLPKSNAPSMGPLQYIIPSNGDKSEHNAPRWEITSGDKIDTETGVLLSGCLKGKALKPVQLNVQSWKKMLDMNEDIVVKGELAEHGNNPYAGGGKGKKRMLQKDMLEKRTRRWNEFKSFLIDQVGPPCNEDNHGESNDGKKRFDVVIDGANVGYFKRNFANAPKYVDYKQIDWVIDHFRSQGKRVLLIMHERHFGKWLMPRWAETIVKRWDEAGILFRTPHGSNDDWFWMHAALWCGRTTMVLSNDLMRDHHFQMLAFRSFLRWKERHQVHFDFGDWNGSKREVKLMYPDVYSRRIQRIGTHDLVIPLPQRGDENRFLDGMHEADKNAPVEETYVSICLKNNQKKTN